MTHQQYYAGAIWTNHARERLGQRGLSQQLAGETFARPDRTLSGKQPGTIEYQKRFGNSTVTVIAKKNERNEWLILSNWIDPPLPGTEDHKKREEWKKYKKASIWGKIWYEIKKQLGL